MHIVAGFYSLTWLTITFPPRANGEIAEVRSKLKSEVSALQAQLRREQLKVQSLENSLDQKVSPPQSEVHGAAFINVFGIICSWKFCSCSYQIIFLAFSPLSPQVKETEELTNLCDELIAKVQKG